MCYYKSKLWGGERRSNKKPPLRELGGKSYMINRKLKNILKLTSVGALLIVAAMGIVIRGDKISSGQISNQNYNADVAGAPELKAEEAEQTKMICQDMLNEDENSLALKEYTKTEIVECNSIGCGGIF